MRDGEKDPFTSIVIVTNMSGLNVQLKCYLFKGLDPSIVKGSSMLKHLIWKYYLVWVGPIAFRVLMNGRIPDKDLFRAVLNGNVIDLKRTDDEENKVSIKAERDASERARLNQEIKEMLNKRRKVAASLNEGASQPIEPSL